MENMKNAYPAWYFLSTTLCACVLLSAFFVSFKLISERKLSSFHNRSIVVAAVACPEPNRSEKVFTNWNLLSTCALQPNFAPQRTLLLPSDCKYIFVGGRGWNHNIYTYFF